MVSVCKKCDRIISSNLVIACTCGVFCSQECLHDYHEEKVIIDYKIKDIFPYGKVPVPVIKKSSYKKGKEAIKRLRSRL